MMLSRRRLTSSAAEELVKNAGRATPPTASAEGREEIPQILNVLRGELSLVGPRPPLPVEAESYEEWQRHRLDVRQGLTGLWQVSGRSRLGFEEMVLLDLYYIENWSLLLDIEILMETLPTILHGDGAY